MVTAPDKPTSPFGLVVSGEADAWRRALETIVGPQWLRTYRVHDEAEVLKVVESGVADAAVLDEEVSWGMDVLHLLRLIRRLDAMLPVVVVTRRRDRRWLETALHLTAFSVVAKPLELEVLLRQIRGMMVRLERMIRDGPATT
jgi:DNA-binding NtrC family response regulator